MSTHKNLDRICVAIVVLSLLVTALFVNGEALGITKIVDEDAEQNSDSAYFTTNDQDGNWDTSGATVITLNGEEATISGNGAYANDGNVVITNGGYYVVSGTLTDGYLSVDAYDSSKVWILLNGVEISCSDDACIRVDQADKVFLTLAEGSQNTLASGSTYSDEALEDGTDGAIFAHDDLTINGSGSLTVNAEYRHGIAANDDLVITGGTITVTAAADAIHAKDSLRIKEASITVEAGDDGLVTSNTEENGYLYIESGTVNITAADDAIHTTGEVTMVGGDVTISAGDDGIHSDTAVYVSDGTLLISECYEGIEALIIDVSGGEITIYPEDDGFNANGGSSDMFGGMGGQMGGQGMSSADTGSSGMNGFAMGGDTANGAQMGGQGMNSDGTSVEGTTGETASSDTANSGMGGGHKGGPGMGGHMGGPKGGQMGSTQSTGQTNGTTGGEMQTPPDMGTTGGEMQTPPDMGTTGGEMQTPSDMGTTGGEMQTADQSTAEEETQSTEETTDEETYISISGGTITIINENGNDADGLDSNGDIKISGGTVYVSLVGQGGNSAVDYASESGGAAEITGGTIIACGASSMAEAFDSTSTQASILYNTSITTEAGTTLAIEDTDGNVLLSWEVPCSFSSALVSCPQMEVGGTYQVVIGDNAEEITLEEVSASYGDAQSSMFGGSMNWGGMQPRSGMSGGSGMPGFGDQSSTGTTGETAADPSGSGAPTGAPFDAASTDSTQASMPEPPSDMQGSTGESAMPEMPSDMQGSTGEGAMPEMSGDMQGGKMQGDAGMTGGPMEQAQEQQELTQEEEDQAAEQTSTATTVDAKSWGILGICTAVMLAAIAVVIFYKRH